MTSPGWKRVPAEEKKKNGGSGDGYALTKKCKRVILLGKSTQEREPNAEE